MKIFSQPVLENDDYRLKNRLKYAEFALYSWHKEAGQKDAQYSAEFIERNIKFFDVQVENINKKLKGL